MLSKVEPALKYFTWIKMLNEANTKGTSLPSRALFCECFLSISILLYHCHPDLKLSSLHIPEMLFYYSLARNYYSMLDFGLR